MHLCTILCRIAVSITWLETMSLKDTIKVLAELVILLWGTIRCRHNIRI